MLKRRIHTTARTVLRGATVAAIAGALLSLGGLCLGAGRRRRSGG